MRSLISAATTSRFCPATRATPGSGGGHGKDRGAGFGDRRLDCGCGHLCDEPFARAGSLRYELRVSGGAQLVKKTRQWRRAKSREKRRESRSDRKLRTFRPGGLWLFTHSAAATGGQLGAAQRKAPLGGERGYVSGHDQRGEGPDPRNQPPGRGVTVTDWRLHTAEPRHIDGGGNQTAEWSGCLRHQPTMSPSALKGIVL